MALVLVAISFVAGITIWYGLALAKMVYGRAIGRHLVVSAFARMDERRFLADDVRELDEAFSRVARSHIVSD